MIKNKEFGKAMALWCIIALTAIIILWWIEPAAGVVSAGFFAFLIAGFFLFTKKRYQSISELSEYLLSVYSGQPCMDIRDNREGELSILKNDIYKVTLTLSEQSTLLKKDKQYLADIMSNISHQLKTPLTSMFVMTDLLNDPNLPGEQREKFLNTIMNQLNRIEWLVSSLLKLSKIDAQAVTFKKECIKGEELISQAVESLRIPAELKNQTLEISCPPDITIQTDCNWTAEALLNIIKNCVEHTKEGGLIRIVCMDSPIHTKILVSDNGEGIMEEDLPHIFERFYKGKNAGQDSVGIGLAMSKTILQEQQADVRVQSIPGEGTSFTVAFYKKVV